MIYCKEATDVGCKKKCCCGCCDNLGSCKEACTLIVDGTTKPEMCECAYTEDSALAIMQKENSVLIKAITNLVTLKSRIEEEEKRMRQELLKAMQKYNIANFENEKIKVTYTKSTVRESIDSKKLKAEMPDVAKKYTKTSEVSAFVKITVK